MIMLVGQPDQDMGIGDAFIKAKFKLEFAETQKMNSNQIL